jgi:glycosyltransferase involved in cell wall biosynthesis/GT2 family glycosyltransferase
MNLGFIEPHLGRVGGIRRMLEFANRLVARGHDVTFYLPDDRPLECTWMACDARIAPISAGADADLDLVLFNHEPDWFLLDRFPRARRRVFYALHYGKLYAKECSYDALRVPVDQQLANSNWTADRIAEEIGVRPIVQLGGVNREVFRPYGGEKRYTVLCSGLGKSWKGTDTIAEACRRLGVNLDGYGELDLPQPALGRAYDAALVFAVGSWFEGFCQPGLEALACGTPLVTTDNGGCREYAIDGETALVVPPRDPTAMAAAIERLLDDEMLAKQLATNGLDLVDRSFDWEARTDELAQVFDGIIAGTTTAPPPPRPAPPDEPLLSIVVLAWDNLEYTEKFCESVRQHTDVPYELIVVDNGSAPVAASFAEHAADVVVLNDANLGFSTGMNQGLEVAKGRWIAFCNNDTILPDHWASTLIETGQAHPRAGIVVPALTAARNPATVRTEPGTDVETVAPFAAPPAAVIYVAPTDLVRQLGGWSTDYEIASGEDVDLCFAVWANDLDIVYDQRVLVDHIGKGSASRLDDWEGLWAANRRRFLEKWQTSDTVPQLPDVDPERFQRNRATAAAVAEWMQRYFTTRDRANGVSLAWSDDDEPTSGEARPSVAGTADRPELVRLETGKVFVLEDGTARPVVSGLIAMGLADVLGEPRPITDDELAAVAPGHSVEVLAAPSGAPFLVVGQRRLPLHGLPLPVPIAVEEYDMLSDGPEVDVAASAGRRAANPSQPTNGKVSQWMETLQRNTTTATPFLVREAKSGKVFVIEGTERRHVTSGLLLSALERELGKPRATTSGELSGWSTGAPVEVFEPPSGAPFVVVGGKRLPVRGLPRLNPVGADDAGRFPKGKALNVASANVPRAQYEAAVSGRYQLQRLRSAVARHGVVGVASKATKRGIKVIRRKF